MFSELSPLEQRIGHTCILISLAGNLLFFAHVYFWCPTNQGVHINRTHATLNDAGSTGHAATEPAKAAITVAQKIVR